MATTSHPQYYLDFINAVKGYIAAFEKKQGLKLEFWVADDIGGTACFGDWFFNFDDIRLDIDREVPADTILEWYDTIEHDKPSVNYASYLKGMRAENLTP